MRLFFKTGSWIIKSAAAFMAFACAALNYSPLMSGVRSMPGAYYAESGEHRFDKAAVAVLLAICILFGYAKSVYSFVMTDKNEELKKAVEYLGTKELSFGYATYWNANITAELSDGQIKMANILDPESMTYFIWSTPKRYYADVNYVNQVFLLLTKEEAEQYRNSKTLTGGEKVYDADGYVIYMYDNAKELLALGTNGGESFR